MGVKGAYSSGKKHFTQLVNTSQKKMGGAISVSTKTSFTGKAALGTKAGSISGGKGTSILSETGTAGQHE